jgi:dTMP kinase
MLITFEGIECSGKSTQSSLLKEYIREKGLPVLSTREPGGTPIGEALRKILKDSNNNVWKENQKPSVLNNNRSSEAETLMYLTSRVELIKQIIEPNILRGINIVLDRFMDSTIAYQGWGKFKGDPKKIEFIEAAHRFILAELFPDLTFLIDIDYEEMCRRKALDEGKTPEEYFESLEKEFFVRARKGFLWMAEREPARFIVIDGTLPEEVIFEQYIKPKIDALLRVRSD